MVSMLVASGAVSGRTPTWRALWGLLTPADRVLIAVLVAATVLSLAWMRGSMSQGGRVRVEVAGRLQGEYPLTEDRFIRVSGPAGTTVIEIRNNAARVAAAPCPHQLCRRRGAIDRQNEVIVCVPNRLVISIVGAAAFQDVDAVVR